MIFEFKQCSDAVVTTTSQFLSSVKTFMIIVKRTIRANGVIHHIFKPNNFRDVQNLNHDKTSMDMTLNQFKLLTSACWNEKYQLLTIDMTKDKNTGR